VVRANPTSPEIAMTKLTVDQDLRAKLNGLSD